MIDQPFPPTFDYTSRGPYTSIVVRRDGTGWVRRKKRLLKACIALYRHDAEDDVLLRQVIDSRGFVLLSCRRDGVLLGCGEAFATLACMADMLGNDWMHDGLLTLELESRIMWPATQ